MMTVTARAQTKQQGADGPWTIEPIDGLDDLVAAFSTLESPDEIRRFLRDLCTLAELEALSHRWQIARLLDEGKLSYLEIAQQVGGSTATVTRVAQWLRAGAGGYRPALDRTQHT